MNWWNILRLKSRDPEVRCKALEKLEFNGSAKVLELLLRRLGDPDGRVRLGAARVLGAGKEEFVYEALVKALQDNRAVVREAATKGLEHRGEFRASQPIAHLLQDDNPGVRAAAATALRKLGWRPCTTEEQALFDVACGHPQRALLAGEAAVPALARELKQDTSFMRRAAAETLAAIDDPRAIRSLLLAASDNDPTVRISVIHALSKGASNSVALTLLKRLLRDHDYRVRVAAAQVLAQRYNPEFEPFFVELLADEHFEVRVAAAEFFGRIREPRHLPLLLARLADPDSDVRQAAARALGEIGHRAALESLILALADEDRGVREAVAVALLRIDSEWLHTPTAWQAGPQLKALASERSAWVQAAVAQVLSQLRPPACAAPPGS